ncbi:hypothetical protein [Streptomyces spinosirectus]
MEDDALAARDARLGCATLVDAVGRVHGHRAHLPAMSSPDPLHPLFGPAATISYLPFRDDLAGTVRDFKHYFYRALGQKPAAGQVLVLFSGGRPEVSHGGGTKPARADSAGGVVIPSASLHRVLAIAEDISAEEAEAARVIRFESAQPGGCGARRAARSPGLHRPYAAALSGGAQPLHKGAPFQALQKQRGWS